MNLFDELKPSRWIWNCSKRVWFKSFLDLKEMSHLQKAVKVCIYEKNYIFSLKYQISNDLKMCSIDCRNDDYNCFWPIRDKVPIFATLE